MTDDDLCSCILADKEGPYAGHTDQDHEDEECSGRWTYEPPCGGCINCDAARAYYYRMLDGGLLDA